MSIDLARSVTSTQANLLTSHRKSQRNNTNNLTNNLNIYMKNVPFEGSQNLAYFANCSLSNRVHCCFDYQRARGTWER